jgi:hypothetical protein
MAGIEEREPETTEKQFKRFRNSRGLPGCVQGVFFLGNKPLGLIFLVCSSSENVQGKKRQARPIP